MKRSKAKTSPIWEIAAALISPPKSVYFLAGSERAMARKLRSLVLNFNGLDIGDTKVPIAREG